MIDMLCVFDVNETLLDLAALDDLFADWFGDPAVRHEWFDRLIYSALTLTAAGGYEQFGALAGAALTRIGEQHGRAVTDDDRATLGRRVASLPAHPDVLAAFDRLAAAGHTVVTLTNSTAAVAEAQLEHAGLRGSVAAVYTADTVRQLKPGPAPYRHVLAEQGVEPDAAVLIAAHDWDVAGAAAAGLRTAFVARDRPWRLAGDVRPTVEDGDLVALAGRIAEW
jgi:2-haloacid dehalogenase